MNDTDKEVWDFIWFDKLEAALEKEMAHSVSYSAEQAVILADAIEKEEAYLMYVRTEMELAERHRKGRVCLQILIAVHIVSVAIIFTAALYTR